MLAVSLAFLFTASPFRPPEAAAYQVPSAPFVQGESATAVMPGSGLKQTITVSGQTELLDATTAGVRGSGLTTYQPAIAGTTPAEDLVVNTGTCASTGSLGIAAP
ncbi:hypothetical protein [Kribbella sp. NBC_00359]|uniref:hypothetical protein n=1 Tax=Kribbella sp. NBC_00359 TaxID=2975966 RepID=UPI002E2011B7